MRFDNLQLIGGLDLNVLVAVFLLIAKHQILQIVRQGAMDATRQCMAALAVAQNQQVPQIPSLVVMSFAEIEGFGFWVLLCNLHRVLVVSGV